MKFPLRTLRGPLAAEERANVRRFVRGLLRWNTTLEVWPRRAPIVDAAPFVTLYARGKLRGCVGVSEGPPAERLARAFVLAAGDLRFGGTGSDDRQEMTAQVAFLRDARAVDADRIEREIEVGREGVALVDAHHRAIALLPSVARDGRLDVDGFLRAMVEKTGVPRAAWGGAGVFLFRTEEVAVRATSAPRSRTTMSAEDAAAAHLARLVQPSGEVTFALDPRSGVASKPGEMHHGRVAVAIRALDERGGHGRVVSRAREKLLAEVTRALRGERVEAWPDRPDVVAGTLALVGSAGLDVHRELAHWVAAHPELQQNPWHAAQVVATLGESAPASLWSACVRDLDARPWAPWTALAATARGDASVLARCVPPIVDSIRSRPPHAGGCDVRPVPETALTALAVEALAAVPAARPARRRACAFLRSLQVGHEAPAPFQSAVATGAFLASPVFELLRADITGHALLALLRE
jgi:AMMECR1 domain-containing protein